MSQDTIQVSTVFDAIARLRYEFQTNPDFLAAWHDSFVLSLLKAGISPTAAAKAADRFFQSNFNVHSPDGSRLYAKVVPVRPINGTVKSLHQLTLEAIDEAIVRNDGDKNKAAKDLGVSLKTIYNKLNYRQGKTDNDNFGTASESIES